MQPFINENEVLLPLIRTKQDNRFGETTFLGRKYTLDMLLDDAGDTCFQILKINTKTKRTEDVTERFAREWLKRFEADQERAGMLISRDDEKYMPDYVQNSAAWADMIDAIELRRPFTSQYSTMRIEERV